MRSYEGMAGGEGSGKDYHVTVTGMLTVHGLCSTLAHRAAGSREDLGRPFFMYIHRVRIYHRSSEYHVWKVMLILECCLSTIATFNVCDSVSGEAMN
jgi:hypothetical protein